MRVPVLVVTRTLRQPTARAPIREVDMSPPPACPVVHNVGHGRVVVQCETPAGSATCSGRLRPRRQSTNPAPPRPAQSAPSCDDWSAGQLIVAALDADASLLSALGQVAHSPHLNRLGGQVRL